jgi:hypothetical protein
MTDLRQEIRTVLFTKTIGYNIEAVDKIIKLIEKRIDELGEPYDTGEGELTHGFNMAKDRMKELLK